MVGATFDGPVKKARRVLIVDDEPAVLEMLGRHFRRDGSQVDLAASAEEVRQRGHFRRNWDVVVTDIHLPGRSGIDLARQMAGRTESMVLVTGDCDGDLAAEALCHVRAGYLVKPFELFELDAAVTLGRSARRPGVVSRMRRNTRRRRVPGSPESMQAKRSTPDRVPVRALLISIGALFVPIAAIATGDLVSARYDFLIFLSALIPPFLLSYYRGWRGAANALALGMVAMVLANVAGELLGDAFRMPDRFAGVGITFVLTSIGAGWLSSRLHARRREAELSAQTDVLTGLSNRARLMSFLDEHCHRPAAGGHGVAVVFFDIDHFKRWNDELGHDAGDEALAAFGEVLRHNTRECDLTARYGGEEFVSVLTHSDYAGAMIYADRMRHALTRLIVRGRRMTVSVGVAFQGETLHSPAQLLGAADAALYAAKAAGRDCVRLDESAAEVCAVPVAS